MKFSDLENAGGTASDELIETPITWINGDGEKHEWITYVKQYKFDQFMKYVKMDEKPDSNSAISLIVESLFEDKDGKRPVMNLEQANKLDFTLIAVLKEKIIEVNTKKKKKTGKKVKSSGTISFLPGSAEEQSQKPSET